jgi:hypothetical protein
MYNFDHIGIGITSFPNVAGNEALGPANTFKNELAGLFILDPICTKISND